MSNLHPPDLPNDDRPMSAEYRERIRGKIADGLKSLAEGKGSDGTAFLRPCMRSWTSQSGMRVSKAIFAIT